MRQQLGKGVFLVMLLVPIVPAMAQCMGSGGGTSHQHGDEVAPARHEPGTSRRIQRLLAGHESRSLLMDAVLADPPFMRELIDRIVALPEWRAVAAERLAAASAGAGPAPTGPNTASGPSAEKAAAPYSCPMHPDVTSDRPGRCPKCGMELRRSE
jgi:hypothetical protein